ncbi:MAG: hypothetical protein ACJ8LN_02700, partial [Sulfurifustis sp.]
MKRSYVLFALIAAMLCVNVWYWWPSRSVIPAGPRTAERWMPDLLRVKVVPDAEKSAPLRRDLFHPKVAIVKAPPPPPPAPPVPPPGPPPKTPEQLAEEAARAELTQIKLVGIVFRAEKGEAFLVKGDQAFIVHRGDK